MNGLARFTRSPATATPAATTDATDRPAPDRASVLGLISRPRPQPAPGEACELCGAPTDPAHPHLVDVEERGLLCACRACALLFTGPATGGERFRTVGSDYVRVEPFVLSAARWNALQIPVGMAFFMVHSQLGHTVAFYPSPAGATECDLPLDDWQAIVDDNPRLANLRPDVEAALVRVGSATTWLRGPGAEDRSAVCFVVPIDRCYELIGELRLHWRGFDGGQDVRAHLEVFFADLSRRAVAP